MTDGSLIMCTHAGAHLVGISTASVLDLIANSWHRAYYTRHGASTADHARRAGKTTNAAYPGMIGNGTRHGGVVVAVPPDRDVRLWP